MALTTITQTAVYQGTIQVPLYAANYTVPHNTSSGLTSRFVFNPYGPTPFCDQLAYGSRGSGVPSLVLDALKNGTITSLSYSGVTTTTFGGGINNTGLTGAANQGGFVNGQYRTMSGDQPIWAQSPAPTTGFTAYNLSSYPLPVDGAAHGIPGTSWQGAITQSVNQFNYSNLQDNVGISRPNNTTCAPVKIEIYAPGQVPIDLGIQVDGFYSAAVTGSGTTYSFFSAPDLNAIWAQNNGPNPALPTSYTPTNLILTQESQNAFILHGPANGQNYMWGSNIGGTVITMRPFGLSWVIGAPVLSPTFDFYSTNYTNYSLTFDDPALNAQLAVGTVKIMPAQNGALMFIETTNADYVMSPDGLKYWKLQYVPQISNVPNLGGFESAAGQYKTIDANGVFWYTGARYSQSPNITPLFSLGISVNPFTINLPAFPPLLLPCFSDCLAKGSVLAKQTNFG